MKRMAAGSRTKERTYKIGDVCKMADVQPYVLRYWETEFPALAPEKGGGGQRAYTQREVDIVLRIKQLLYSEGFTIAGAKKRLESELAAPPVESETAKTATAAATTPAVADVVARQTLQRMRSDLSELLDLLKR